MTSYIITPATELALSLDDAKVALRADGTDLDTEITGAIIGITQDLEDIIGQCVMPQTWRVQTDTFPADGLSLPHPAKEIVSVTYRDADGGGHTLATDQYRIVVARYESLLVATAGNTFPVTDGSIDAVKVDVIAQMATTADETPPAIKLYIQMKLKQQYDPASRVERDTVQSNFTDDLLNQFKVKP